jgi:hypothetical protein
MLAKRRRLPAGAELGELPRQEKQFRQDRGSFSGLEATICIASTWNLPLVDVYAGVDLD